MERSVDRKKRWIGYIERQQTHAEREEKDNLLKSMLDRWIYGGERKRDVIQNAL